jgi:hypothetical protein
VAARVGGDHCELPTDAVELLRQARPADRQGFIQEVTGALAVAAKTNNFRWLQDVLEGWMLQDRLQRQPGAEAMIRADAAPRAWRPRGSRPGARPSRRAP